MIKKALMYVWIIPIRQYYFPNTSSGRPQKLSWRPQDVSICSYMWSQGTQLQQDVNLTIIHKISFYRIFNVFPQFQLYIRHCTVKVSLKPDMSYFGPIMVRDVLTKIRPIGDVLSTFCAGWVIAWKCIKWLSN